MSDWYPANEEKPTMELRFNGGALEQKFYIRNGDEVRYEWRRVPSVTEMAVADAAAR